MALCHSFTASIWGSFARHFSAPSGLFQVSYRTISFHYLNLSPTGVIYMIEIGYTIQNRFHQMCMIIDIHKHWEFSAHDLFQFPSFYNVHWLDLFHNPNVRFQLFNI